MLQHHSSCNIQAPRLRRMAQTIDQRICINKPGESARCKVSRSRVRAKISLNPRSHPHCYVLNLLIGQRRVDHEHFLAASVTVAEAAALWIASCSGLERATVTTYRQHVGLHIIPLLGNVKLSRLDIPTIRSFEDRRSGAMVKKVLSSLGSLVGEPG